MSTQTAFDRAYAMHRDGDARGALEIYGFVLSKEPRHFDALMLSAMAELQLSRPEAAAGYLERALELKPDNVEALNALGDVMIRLGRLDDAIARFKDALEIAPASPAVLVNYGNALNQAGRHADAVAKYDAAIMLQPDQVVAHFNRAAALKALGRHEDAIAALREALRIEPGFAEAANNMGAAYSELGRVDEAIGAYRHAVEIAPRYERAWINLGRTLAEKARPEEAVEALRRAVELAPANAEAAFELGRALMLVERPDEAAAEFRRALEIDPHNNDAGLNLALALLVLRRFGEAWPYYECRFRSGRLHRSSEIPVNPHPERWADARALADGPLAVLGEQGLGDEIMFASIMPDICEVTREVVMTAEPRLVGLFGRSFPGIEVVPHRKADLGAIEAVPVERRASIGSLARLFRSRIEDFPGTPYLVADPERRGKMRTRLDALGAGAKIGIMWRGGVGGKREQLRSLDLADMRPILGARAHWVSLSHVRNADRETRAFGETTGIFVHHWPEILRSDDYDDTAALLAELDAVVSVTGTVAHCAAALGVDTHVLVNRVPEWRYGHEGTSIPWYKSMTLYRQTDAWPLDAVAGAVRGVIARHGGHGATA